MQVPVAKVGQGFQHLVDLDEVDADGQSRLAPGRTFVVACWSMTVTTLRSVRSPGSSSPRRAERLIDVGYQVIDVLDADREPDRLRGTPTRASASGDS